MEVRAPLSLLTAPNLEATEKLLWLALHLHPAPIRRPRLAADSALTQNTIRKALANLQATGWYPPALEYQKPHITIPAALLAEPLVRPQAKLLYGWLPHLAPLGLFTYAGLAETTRLSLPTVRASVQDLARAGWLELKQTTQRAPIHYTRQTVDHPEVAKAKQRLMEADFRCEELMRAYLTLLIDSNEYEENAAPAILENPLTGEPLQLDRYYYQLSVGFEYNGPQHYRTTRRFPNANKLAMRKARDLMKEALCARRGISVVVITWDDLTLQGMQRRIGKGLPLRNLDQHSHLIDYLERARYL